LKENFDRFSTRFTKEKEQMADFRKAVFALAPLALLMGVAGSASAQTQGVSCTPIANTPIVVLRGYSSTAADAVWRQLSDQPSPVVCQSPASILD